MRTLGKRREESGFFKDVADVPHLGANPEFARCFLRLANLPNFALDRLSRYEATLSRQVSRILFALEALDRCKPQERRRPFWPAGPQKLSYEGE